MVRLAALPTRTRIVAAVVRLVRFRETARHATAAVVVTVTRSRLPFRLGPVDEIAEAEIFRIPARSNA